MVSIKNCRRKTPFEKNDKEDDKEDEKETAQK
jgi:hypothetical protein